MRGWAFASITDAAVAAVAGMDDAGSVDASGGCLVTRAKNAISDRMRGQGSVPAWPIPRRGECIMAAEAFESQSRLTGVVATTRVKGKGGRCGGCAGEAIVVVIVVMKPAERATRREGETCRRECNKLAVWVERAKQKQKSGQAVVTIEQIEHKEEKKEEQFVRKLTRDPVASSYWC